MLLGTVCEGLSRAAGNAREWEGTVLPSEALMRAKMVYALYLSPNFSKPLGSYHNLLQC